MCSPFVRFVKSSAACAWYSNWATPAFCSIGPVLCLYGASLGASSRSCCQHRSRESQPGSRIVGVRPYSRSRKLSRLRGTSSVVFHLLWYSGSGGGGTNGAAVVLWGSAGLVASRLGWTMARDSGARRALSAAISVYCSPGCYRPIKRERCWKIKTTTDSADY